MTSPHPALPIHPAPVKVRSADLLFFTRGPDLQGQRGTAWLAVAFHLEAGERGVRGGAASGLSDQRFALLLEAVRKILPGDGVEDDVGGAGLRCFEPSCQPVDRVCLFHLQVIVGGDGERILRALQAVRLVCPDVGELAQAVVGEMGSRG